MIHCRDGHQGRTSLGAPASGGRRLGLPFDGGALPGERARPSWRTRFAPPASPRGRSWNAFFERREIKDARLPACSLEPFRRGRARSDHERRRARQEDHPTLERHAMHLGIPLHGCGGAASEVEGSPLARGPAFGDNMMRWRSTLERTSRPGGLRRRSSPRAVEAVPRGRRGRGAGADREPQRTGERRRGFDPETAMLNGDPTPFPMTPSTAKGDNGRRSDYSTPARFPESVAGQRPGRRRRPGGRDPDDLAAKGSSSGGRRSSSRRLYARS